jgi:UDP-2,4-diacetamido-2,4,6-trideoxy-beta-L-altropyranose hydrolase
MNHPTAIRSMRVALRADASARIGIGHVKRTLALGFALRDLGAEVCLVTRDLGVDVTAMSLAAGIKQITMSAPKARIAAAEGEGVVPHAAWAEVDWDQDVKDTVAALITSGHAWCHDTSVHCDWIVVDHYAFDERWHREVSCALGALVAVIDDLADRTLQADVLIDHNLSSSHASKYAPTRSRIRRLLGGPRYALLDSAYSSAPRYEFNPMVHSVGIFVGGSDPCGATLLALNAVRGKAGFGGAVEVVSTTANPQLASLRVACEADPGTTLLLDLAHLRDFYVRHDIQIGAGGGAAWERCCIGAPTLLMTLADNQRTVGDGLHAIGAACLVSQVDQEAIADAFVKMLKDIEYRRSLGLAGRQLVDGLGAKRVAVALTSSRVELRVATMADARTSYVWRNDERTRRYSRSAEELSLDNHLNWWTATLGNPDSYLLIAQIGLVPVGVLRLDSNAANAEVSIYIDPALAGVGLGTHILEAGVRWAGHRQPPLRALIAEIDAQNVASAAAFAAIGFTRQSERRWIRHLGKAFSQ